VIVISLLTGVDPMQLLQGVEQVNVQEPSGQPGDAPTDELGQFASTVLADTEDVWQKLFAAEGQSYQPPVMTLFSGSVSSACGMASSAVGPFYCPLNNRVYLDLGFFQLLAQRFGAPGDFAAAYVIAHEVGHHVQNLAGIADNVREAQRRAWDQAQANELSVRMELQADCLAGVWAHHAHRDRNLLEPGDVEEGLRAAAAIGDDQMQRQAQGVVVPESFTHGSSQQRVEWLRRGIESGDPDSCETFR
jgi:predicted metalloprotease